MTDDERGYCSTCFRWFRINRDGTLRHHGGPQGTGLAWQGNRGRAYRCDGAGTRPVATRPAGKEVPR